MATYERAVKTYETVEINKWIPIKTRPLTEEERELFGDKYDFMYEGQLPEDGQDVLITHQNGKVYADTFCNFGTPYFETYCDEGEVIAWQPFPKPYKAPGAAEPGKSKKNRKCDNCAYYQWTERTNKCNQCQDYSHWIKKPGAAEPEED